MKQIKKKYIYHRYVKSKPSKYSVNIYKKKYNPLLYPSNFSTSFSLYYDISTFNITKEALPDSSVGKYQYNMNTPLYFMHRWPPPKKETEPEKNFNIF